MWGQEVVNDINTKERNFREEAEASINLDELGRQDSLHWPHKFFLAQNVILIGECSELWEEDTVTSKFESMFWEFEVFVI